jgi:hypothetical protein
MNAEELIKFLKLLRAVACLNGYWKQRIDEVIVKIGGQV